MNILTSLFSRVSRKGQSSAGLCSEACVSFFNYTANPRVICVEPWGADYTLAPNERFELVAYNSQSEPSFELRDDHQHSTQVWCEAETFEVRQEGKILECGYNRDMVRRDASQVSRTK